MRLVFWTAVLVVVGLCACGDDSGSNSNTNDNGNGLCGNGVLDSDEECDSTALCCDPSTCTLRATSEVCRPAVGECDLAESCDGVTETCPADEPVGDGQSCTDGTCQGGVCVDMPTFVQWTPVVLRTFTAQAGHTWDEFPLQVTLSHEGGESLTVDGHWTGGSDWAVRIAPTRTGLWTWQATTATGDPGLEDAGEFFVTAPTPTALSANANLRGHVQIQGRYFRYADDTAFFLQGDTLWFFNATWTYDLYTNGAQDHPLGTLADSFYDWLADRTAKNYNAVLVRWVAGHEKAVDSANEGGYLWDVSTQPPDQCTVDWTQLNPAYFDALDTRVQAIWEAGMVILGHPAWIGEEASITSVAQAENVHRYLLARYGAYNLMWSLSGEYHKDEPGGVDWTSNDWANYRELGRRVGGSTSPAYVGYNAYGHPMSVHPGGSDQGQPEPNGQTSRDFEGEDWLDHHWIQSYSETDKIVYRVAELRGLIPGGLTSGRPALLSEPCYERATGPTTCRHTGLDQGSNFAETEASTMRRQAWLAMVAGAAGYVYGADGVWIATTPTNLDLPGSAQIQHVRALFETLDWQQLGLADCVEVQDTTWSPPDVDYPGTISNDYVFAPRCAKVSGDTYVVYIPGGNAAKNLRMAQLDGQAYHARWYDPRDGSSTPVSTGPTYNDDGNNFEPIPSRPSGAANNDWVFVLTLSPP